MGGKWVNRQQMGRKKGSQACSGGRKEGEGQVVAVGSAGQGTGKGQEMDHVTPVGPNGHKK